MRKAIVSFCAALPFFAAALWCAFDLGKAVAAPEPKPATRVEDVGCSMATPEYLQALTERQATEGYELAGVVHLLPCRIILFYRTRR